MISEKDSVEIRQFGRIFWNIYQGCLEAGFNESQAFEILKTYVTAFAAPNISSPGPPSDDFSKE
jgi:hypothetical protein